MQSSNGMGKTSKRRKEAADADGKDDVKVGYDFDSGSESSSGGYETADDPEAMLAALDLEDEDREAELQRQRDQVRTDREDALPSQHVPLNPKELDDYVPYDDHLIDAWDFGEQNPERYTALPGHVIETIQVGYNVKIMNSRLPFWTRVSYIKSDRLYTTVENRTQEFELGDKISFRVCFGFVAVTDRELAQDVLEIRLRNGDEVPPSEEEKQARHMGKYLAANWAEHPDPFHQGAKSPEQAMYSPVDHLKVMQHFADVHPDGLEPMGLSVEDFNVCHLASRDEIAESWKHADAAKSAIFAGLTDDQAIDKVWKSPVNLTIQTALWVAAYDA